MVLYNSIAYMLVKRWYAARQLQRNTRNELVCMTDISTTSREEEAGSQAFLVGVSTADRSCDRRLSCTSQTVQPENAPFILCISPVVYLLEEIDVCVLQAGGFVLLRVRV